MITLDFWLEYGILRINISKFHIHQNDKEYINTYNEI